MKQVIIIWENGEHTTISGKNAFRIALNWLNKIREFENFSFYEVGNTHFFIHNYHRIEWFIKPRKEV